MDGRRFSAHRRGGRWWALGLVAVAICAVGPVPSATSAGPHAASRWLPAEVLGEPGVSLTQELRDSKQFENLVGNGIAAAQFGYPWPGADPGTGEGKLTAIAWLPGADRRTDRLIDRLWRSIRRYVEHRSRVEVGGFDWRRFDLDGPGQLENVTIWETKPAPGVVLGLAAFNAPEQYQLDALRSAARGTPGRSAAYAVSGPDPPPARSRGQLEGDPCITTEPEGFQQRRVPVCTTVTVRVYGNLFGITAGLSCWGNDAGRYSWAPMGAYAYNRGAMPVRLEQFPAKDRRWTLHGSEFIHMFAPLFIPVPVDITIGCSPDPRPAMWLDGE